VETTVPDAEPTELLSALEPEGGQGEESAHHGRGTMAMVRRAIREEWPISPATKAAVVEQMDRIVRRTRNNRDKIAAAKVLVAADGVNVRREAVAVAGEAGPQDERRPLVVFYLPERREDAPAVVVDASPSPITLPARQDAPP
jgi:hypothetical protein